MVVNPKPSLPKRSGFEVSPKRSIIFSLYISTHEIRRPRSLPFGAGVASNVLTILGINPGSAFDP